MSYDEVVFHVILVRGIVEIVLGLLRVCKDQSTSSVFWGQFIDQEERIACSSWVEG
jgi:hypothetical protein